MIISELNILKVQYDVFNEKIIYETRFIRIKIEQKNCQV